MDNTIISYNGIEIYKSDVNRIIDDFILDYSIDEDMLYKTNTFISLLSFIRENLLKNIITKNNGTNKNGYDYNLLDTIFNTIFIPVCGKYNHILSLWNFSILTGINNNYLNEVLNGQYRNGSKVKQENTDIVKKWYDASRASTLTQAQELNSVGSIFIAKSVYGLQETPQELIVKSADMDTDPVQIMERYKNIEKPKLIELNDN